MLHGKNTFLVFGGAGSVILWLLSFIAFAQPVLQVLLVILFLVGFTYLAFAAYPWALMVLFLELVVGNKGSLFSFPFFDIAIALRLALFSILFLAWFVLAVRTKRLLALRQTPYFWPWLALMLVVLFGIVNGFLRSGSSLVYFDANGYLFFLAFLPLSFVMLRREWWSNLQYLLLGATTAVAVLTIVFSLLFTSLLQEDQFAEATAISDEQLIALEQETGEAGKLAQTTTLGTEKILLDEGEGSGIGAVYRWMRDTGNGEVSYIGSQFFRVFFISQLYVFLAFLFLFARLAMQGFRAPGSRWLIILLLLHAGAMAVSFSRSLWLAFGVALFVLFVLLPRSVRLRVGLTFALVLVLVTAGAALLFPELSAVFLGRLQSILTPTGELASTARLSLLTPLWERIQEHVFLGSGFGTTVSFRAPIAGTDTVETIRVYLFEWAYLDLIAKVGLLGLAIFLTFLGAGLREGIRVLRQRRSPTTVAALSAFVLLIVVHITTPYLNHPIGISALLLLMGFFFAQRQTVYA